MKKKPAAYFYLQQGVNIEESTWGPKRPTQMTKTMYTHVYYKKAVNIIRTQHQCTPYLEKPYNKYSKSGKGSPKRYPKNNAYALLL